MDVLKETLKETPGHIQDEFCRQNPNAPNCNEEDRGEDEDKDKDKECD